MLAADARDTLEGGGRPVKRRRTASGRTPPDGWPRRIAVPTTTDPPIGTRAGDLPDIVALYGNDHDPRSHALAREGEAVVRRPQVVEPRDASMDRACPDRPRLGRLRRRLPGSSPAASTARPGPSAASAASRSSSPAARGRTSIDLDGNRYLDYVGSWGPLILGHAHPRVVAGRRGGAAPRRQLRRPDRARDAARRADHRRRAVDRDGPHGQLRHRGVDERHPPGPRLHRPRRDRQVRRLLPRPRRQPARRRPAPAPRRSACRTAPACRTAAPPTRSSLRYNDVAGAGRRLRARTATRSPA